VLEGHGAARRPEDLDVLALDAADPVREGLAIRGGRGEEDEPDGGREEDDDFFLDDAALLVGYLMRLVEDDPREVLDERVAALEHGGEDFRRHDEAGRVRIDGDVPRQDADARAVRPAEAPLEVRKLLVRERLDRRGWDTTKGRRGAQSGRDRERIKKKGSLGEEGQRGGGSGCG
jgi:hypothetical protein